MSNFSQHDEQKHILAAFEGHPPGKALDLGAYHPEILSNTRQLYLNGWSLTMIEPSPGPMRALLTAYGNDPRVTLVQAAVGLPEWPKLTCLHITDDALSTSSSAEYEKWKDQGGFFGKLLVPKITLEEIAYQFQGFQFISIDAEGCSVDLFKHAMELQWAPHCFCVENDGRCNELLACATQHHYHAVYVNQTNSVLVRG